MTIEAYILKTVILTLKYFSFFSTLKFYRFPLPLPAIICLSLAMSFFKNSRQGFLDIDEQNIFSGYFLLQEICLGILLAFPWVLFFELLPLTLKLFDLLRGIFIAEQQFPGIESRQSSLEGLGTYLIIILFFYLGGYEQMFQSLFFNERIEDLDSFIKLLLISSNEVIKLSLKIIFPVMTLLFSQEILQIVLLRLLPRLNLGIEFQNFKLCFSLFLLKLLLENNIPQLLNLFSGQIFAINSFWNFL